MEYVPVLGVAPSIAVQTPVNHYFSDYLISIAEPTTSRGWTMQEIYKQMRKIKRGRIPHMQLYLDSGGYQVITGHIVEKRIREFTDVYHSVVENFIDEFDFIFSLDINTPKFDKEKIIKYNDYSIDSSIDLMKKFPQLREKQLFVVQSRFSHILEDWLELMDKHDVFLYYDLFSFGGLVGLKQSVRSQFNHFVPMTLWLLTYIKNRRKRQTPFPSQLKHIHMLGQSSRVAVLTGIILEKLFNIKITMDSSEIIRFTPIGAKTPLIHTSSNTDADTDVDSTNFNIIQNLAGMQDMIDAHSDPKAHTELENMKIDLLEGKVTNQTFVEIICQNLSNLISFGNHLVDTIDINDIINWGPADFENFHDVFKIGRLSTEISNNMRLIRTLKPYYDDNNFTGVHEHVTKIINNYYSTNQTRKIKAGEI